jgi:ABC-type lipoprotein export system ATPase subunit
MSQNINFYENDNVKKKNPQRDDQQLEFTGIKLRSRNLLCGASGSGKTNALMNDIFLSSKPKKRNISPRIPVLQT